jgi:hypothetical protein
VLELDKDLPDALPETYDAIFSKTCSIVEIQGLDVTLFKILNIEMPTRTEQRQQFFYSVIKSMIKTEEYVLGKFLTQFSLKDLSNKNISILKSELSDSLFQKIQSILNSIGFKTLKEACSKKSQTLLYWVVDQMLSQGYTPIGNEDLRPFYIAFQTSLPNDVDPLDNLEYFLSLPKSEQTIIPELFLFYLHRYFEEHKIDTDTYFTSHLNKNRDKPSAFILHLSMRLLELIHDEHALLYLLDHTANRYQIRVLCRLANLGCYDAIDSKLSLIIEDVLSTKEVHTLTSPISGLLSFVTSHHSAWAKNNIDIVIRLLERSNIFISKPLEEFIDSLPQTKRKQCQKIWADRLMLQMSGHENRPKNHDMRGLIDNSSNRALQYYNNFPDES